MQLIAQAYLTEHALQQKRPVKVMLTNPEPQPAGDSFKSPAPGVLFFLHEKKW